MTSITGLIGFPVSHSLSPRIHEYWITKHMLSVTYKLFTTPPPRLRQTMLHMRKKNVAGVNITIPHKQVVMEYLDNIDEVATRVGAVNTVINKNGSFIGSNTDVYGFITNLREAVGAIDSSKYLKNVVILGAGGATRAIIVALKDAGAQAITLTNRSADKALALAEEFQITHLPWEVRHEALAEASLLVNSTSLGMQGHPGLDIDLSGLPKDALVHDIVYAPLETELLRAAKARGNVVVDGLGMLLYQAQKAFELWHGILPEVTPELRQLVLEPAL
ncbi:MAG: shikimate dehydrogenase [Rickettsiales bacterium]